MNLGYKCPTAVAGASLAALLLLPAIALAHAGLGSPPPGLASAANYSLLAGTTITVAGATTISGDVGVSPGSAITGMPVGQPTGGTVHSADPSAGQAQADVATAYDFLVAMPCDSIMSGLPLGGATLTPGVHCFATTAGLAGVLNLDAQGDTGAVFVFQIGTTFSVGGGSSVNLENGAQARHVWWQVGSSADFAGASMMVGNILAFTSISFASGATLDGRALARGGAVTLVGNNINSPGDTGTPALGVSWGLIKSRYR
jgi:type VI secretion system secreted protein VgrG